MISNSLNTIINNLYHSIDLVASNISCYCKDPVSDFTRNRKLPVRTLIDYLIQNQSKANKSELCDYFTEIHNLPSDSALCQQREKLTPLAMKRVFDLFNHSHNVSKTWKGYHILACDGSDVNIPLDISDKNTLVKNGKNKAYSQFHINALYDCLNQIYWDLEIGHASKTQECSSLIDMINERKFPVSSLILADRGYESYNLIATCLEKNQKFAIRVKDITSNGILSPLSLPDGEWDMDITRIITRKQTKETKNEKERYVILTNCSGKFDYLENECEYYEMKLRVVRFKISEDTYECIITNLERDEFSPAELKELYHMRWNEETSFRELKYKVGLINFHSKKREFLKQEIYARFILFNLSNMIIKGIDIQKVEGKYDWKVNYAAALTNIRRYLRKEIDLDNLIARIKKFLVPVRPERKYSRDMKPKSVIPLNYKVS